MGKNEQSIFQIVGVISFEKRNSTPEIAIPAASRRD